MSAIRHSISSSQAALLVMLTMLGVGGCSNSLLSTLRPTNEPQSSDIVSSTTKATKALPMPPLRPKVEPVVDIIPASAREIESRERSSSWCEQIRENTAAETSILRSPSLSGSLNDSGKAALSLGLSYSDFKRANLMEKAAEVRCRKYLAETGLNVLVFVSPQNLTAVGYRAKSDTIINQAKEISSLRKAISKALNGGAIDREKATALEVLLDRLISEGNAAKSQADRRTNERLLDGKNSDSLSRELLKAETDLDHINSEITTASNIDVKAEVGWSDDVSSNDTYLNDQAFTGKVSFSMKLGAFDPRRFEHERRATDLKLRAIGSEEGGLIWQVGILKRAHERAISGLEESRINIEKAVVETRRLLAVLQSEPMPDFEGARLSARIEIIKLKAERAGVIGSLAEIKKNLDRLKNG